MQYININIYLTTNFLFFLKHVHNRGAKMESGYFHDFFARSLINLNRDIFYEIFG